MNKSDSQRCPSCNKATLVLDENSGELACSTCGIVVTEKGAADGPEWRSLMSLSTSSPFFLRTSTPTTLIFFDLTIVSNHTIAVKKI